MAAAGRNCRLLVATVFLVAVWAAGLAPASALEELTIVVPAREGTAWDETARAAAAAIEHSGLADRVRVENQPDDPASVLARFTDETAGGGPEMLLTGRAFIGTLLARGHPLTLADTSPIARLTGEFEVIVVSPSSEFRTLEQILERHRTDPDSLAWGGGSAGGTDHILTLLLIRAAGLGTEALDYRPHSTDRELVEALRDGRLTVAIGGLSGMLPFIESGHLRAVAVSSPARIAGFDIATLRESGLDLDLANWHGLFATRGIAEEDRRALAEIVGRMASSAPWRESLARRHWMDLYQAGPEFRDFVEHETARVRSMLRTIGVMN